MGASTGTALAALKIGSRVAFERLTRPKARRLDDVPCSPYAITVEWLTAVLCGKIPGAIVTHVEVRPASAGTHERHQLIVSYNEEGRRAALPVSIFTKSLPSIVTRMIGGFNGTRVPRAISIRSFDLSCSLRRRCAIILPTIGKHSRRSISWKTWSPPRARRFAITRPTFRAPWQTT
jgi:hypothetical protein